jgi:hypothetical protein
VPGSRCGKGGAISWIEASAPRALGSSADRHSRSEGGAVRLASDRRNVSKPTCNRSGPALSAKRTASCGSKQAPSLFPASQSRRSGSCGRWGAVRARGPRVERTWPGQEAGLSGFRLLKSSFPATARAGTGLHGRWPGPAGGRGRCGHLAGSTRSALPRLYTLFQRRSVCILLNSLDPASSCKPTFTC